MVDMLSRIPKKWKKKAKQSKAQSSVRWLNAKLYDKQIKLKLNADHKTMPVDWKKKKKT